MTQEEMTVVVERINSVILSHRALPSMTPEDMEDIRQDVFLILLTKKRPKVDKFNYNSWIGLVTIGVLNNLRRKQVKNQEYLDLQRGTDISRYDFREPYSYVSMELGDGLTKEERMILVLLLEGYNKGQVSSLMCRAGNYVTRKITRIEKKVKEKEIDNEIYNS